ncbi:MAG TPA: FHA domain-containing protein [Polyangiaceae bacterium]|nr:FHA domain-containing protein [Polyangiaceae bacterium]
MRFRLRYLHHDLELTEGEFVVGRNASCQLSLDDPLVSRRHAVFRVTSTAVTVEDLQSRNGVLVNGQRIAGSIALATGDRLLIGSQEMTLLVVVEEQSARARLNMTLPKITPADPVTPLASSPSPMPSRRSDSDAQRPTPVSAQIIARIHSSTTEPGSKTDKTDKAEKTEGSHSSPALPIAGRTGSTPGTPWRAIATAPGAPPSPSHDARLTGQQSARADLSPVPSALPRSAGASGSGPVSPPSPPSRHPPPATPSPADVTPEPEFEMTMVRRADAFSLLAGVAEKALAMGRAVEAERILASPLGDVIEASRAGKRIIPTLVDQAARFSAKLATATGKGAWADYVIELYSAQRRPCPAPVIDELYNALRRVTAIDLQRLREYIEDLRARLPTFGPAERFLFQRLEGLERLAALR